MNPISYSLNKLRFQIPPEILEKTFLLSNSSYGPNTHYHNAASLDAAIRDRVIEARVMVDCNLIGGTETYIPLAGLQYERIDNFTVIYRIPKSMTQNRTITRALSVAFGYGSAVGATNSSIYQGSTLADAASGVLASQTPIPDVSTAYVQLIGENVIMIRDSLMSLPTNLFLRCRLENDSNFNHLQPTSYESFSKLVEYATKAYIYNVNRIPMDRAYLSGGQELGAYSDVIQSYSDAEQNYQDHFRISFRKVSLFNDFEQNSRHLKLLVGRQ